jgi:hypothetical protein
LSDRRIVEVSFGDALKFWIAMLIILITVAMITFVLGAVICGAFIHRLLQGLLGAATNADVCSYTLGSLHEHASLPFLTPTPASSFFHKS